ETAQEIGRDLQAILGAAAPIVDRLEVLGDSKGRAFEVAFPQRRLDLRRTFGSGRHAAETRPLVLDLPVLDPQAIGGGDGGNVLIAPLAHLVAKEGLARPNA